MKKRVLLVKTSAFGDIVQTFYVIEDIRRQREDIEIIWCVDQRFSSVAQLHPSVSRVITVPTRAWRSHWYRLSTWQAIANWIRQLRANDFYAAIDLQGMYKSALIVALSGAKRTIGRRREYASEGLSSFLYRERVKLPKTIGLAAGQRDFVASILGYKLDGLTLSAGLIPGGHDLNNIVFVVGASVQEKRWPAESWAELALECFRKYACSVTLVWGSKRELEIARFIRSKVPQVRVLESVLPVADLLSLYKRSRLIIGTDTGPTHLAVALSAPTMMIFGKTTPVNYSDSRLKHLRVIGSKFGWPTTEMVGSQIEGILGVENDK